jgi:hypothetical protein
LRALRTGYPGALREPFADRTPAGTKSSSRYSRYSSKMFTPPRVLLPSWITIRRGIVYLGLRRGTRGE